VKNVSCYFEIFLSRVNTLTRDIDTANVILSVCLSVTFRY